MNIAFKVASGMLGKVITAFTGADDGPLKLSHVELQFSDEYCWSSDPNSAGCRFSLQDLTNRAWIVMRLRATPLEESVVRDWCQSQVDLHTGYDWLDILRFALPFGEHDSRRLICSEACALALQHIGWLPRVQPYQLSPNGLFDAIGEYTVGVEPPTAIA